MPLPSWTGSSIALLLTLLLGHGYVLADVYVVERADGSTMFANYPVTAEYRLLIRDTVTASAPVTIAPLRESEKQRTSRLRLEPFIVAAAAAHGVDPALLRAVIHVESRFNPSALSPAGAAGAMQLMPGTASRYGVGNRNDPRQNVDAGARYLRDLIHRFDGNIALALSAYNAGEGSVERRDRRIPPYRETLTYVPEVMARAEEYRAMSSLPAQQ
jgi:soluble lytic murein transglycosylase-like protein